MSGAASCRQRLLRRLALCTTSNSLTHGSSLSMLACCLWVTCLFGTLGMLTLCCCVTAAWACR